MDSIHDQISGYLIDHEQEMLDHWYSQVIISEDDIKELVIENGRSMFHLVNRYITNEINLTDIRLLAEKVAAQRVLAEINIGDFVHNVSLGRSIILNSLTAMNLLLTEYQPILQKINECFDTFLYHAVSRYTDLKNTDLEEKKLFIERTHKERLTILGQMSSSFVHEFRNPLTSIMGFVKLLQSQYPSLEYLDIMSHELEQLNFRISQFLHVSKKEVSEEIKTTLNLNDLILETLEFLYPSIVDGEVEVITNLDSSVTVFAARNQIRQILINIIINSIDALQHLLEKRKLFIYAYSGQEFIEISISNNGPQIPAEMMKTIFEPFVTTKELGTGIGLYVCKQIMEMHNGNISCSSENALTTFSLHFPFVSRASCQMTGT